MVENIVIEFTSNTEGITTAEQAVQQLDKTTADQFTKTNNSLKQNEDQWRSNAGTVERFTEKVKAAGPAAASAFSAKALKDFNNALNDLENNFNNKWNPVVKKAIEDANRLKTAVAGFGGGVAAFKVPEYFKKTSDAANALNPTIVKSKTNFLDLARVLQDLPFGFQGIQNNLTQLIPGVGAAGLAFSALVAAITFAQVGLTYWTRGSHDATNGSDKLKDSIDTLNKAFESSDYKGAYTQVHQLTENIKLAKEGFLDKKEVLNQYNETLGKSTGEVKSLDEAESMLVKKGPAYIQIMLLQAAANIELEQAAKKAVEAEQTRLKKREEFAKTLVDTRILPQGTFNAQEYDAETQRIAYAQAKRKSELFQSQKAEEKERLDSAKRFQESAAKIAKDSGVDLLGGQFDDKKKKDVKTMSDVIADLRKELTTLAGEQAIRLITPQEADIDRVKAYEKAFKGLFDLKATENTPIVKQLKVEFGPINQRVLEDQIHALVQKLSIQDAIQVPDFSEAIKKQRQKVIQNTVEANQKMSDLSEQSYVHDLENLKSYLDADVITRDEYNRRVEFLRKEHDRSKLDNDIALNEALIENLKSILPPTKENIDIVAGYERKLNEDKAKLYEQDGKNFEKNERSKTRIAEQEIRSRQRVEEFITDAAKTVGDAYFDNLKSSYQEDAELNQQLYDNKQITQQEFNKRQKQIQKEQAAADKEKAVFDILIEGAKALFQIEAQAAIFTASLNFPAAAIAASQIPFLLGSEAIQLALIAARKFKHGKVSIDGPGTETSDSIPAWLSKNESVINAASTKKWKPALHAINNDTFESWLANFKPAQPIEYPSMSMPQFEMPTMGTLPKWAETKSHSPTFEIDYDKLGKSVAKHVGRIEDLPSYEWNVDNDGLSQAMIHRNQRTKFLNNKYSFKRKK